MNRRDVLKGSLVGGAMLASSRLASAATEPSASPPGAVGILTAGFAREKITPPLGTRMMGFGSRDCKQGCQGVHDDVHVRALFLEHKGERVLILAYDLCFVGREEADRFKGALGREFDLLPRQILINTSHNHVSPAVGTWYWAGYLPVSKMIPEGGYEVVSAWEYGYPAMLAFGMEDIVLRALTRMKQQEAG